MKHEEGCEFQPKSAETEQIDCTCDRDGLDNDEHYITCPVILTPEVLAYMGLAETGDDACTDESNTNQI